MNPTPAFSGTVKSGPMIKVVMAEGPIFENGHSLFIYKGTVKNTGNEIASWVRITLHIRKSDGSLIISQYSYADDYDVGPGASSAWNILFGDMDGAIRKDMNQSKTTFEITWEEPSER